MNTAVSVTISLPAADTAALINDVALPAFAEAEQHCSRFIDGNQLSVLNRNLSLEVSTSPVLFEAVNAAYRAYERTGGLFDPRVLSDLDALGYNQSFEHIAGAHSLSPMDAREALPPWEPTFRQTASECILNIGVLPIDLGGIVKGRTVDRVAELLRTHAHSALINAGGDIRTWGTNPEGEPWLIGVENPAGDANADPLAVVALTDSALATSSSRKRQWRTTDDRTAHHLIDPRTGRSAFTGLRSVTVTHASAEFAEVCSKFLFVAGADQIEDLAAQLSVEALWVRDSGALEATPTLLESIVWRAT